MSAKRTQSRKDPKILLGEIESLIRNLRTDLDSRDLRDQTRALIPVFHGLRRLGCALVRTEGTSSARDRILYYLQRHPMTVVHGGELMVVSGIQAWRRRTGELRVELGWPIVSGRTAREMDDEGDFPVKDVEVQSMRPDDYILLSLEPDLEAARRWKTANQIRKEKGGVKTKILRYLQENLGRAVTGEELRYLAQNRTVWTRRIRELRSEEGWPIVTRNTGRPDLPIGTYLLEANRQVPTHDRDIPDPIRRKVLRQQGYRCQECDWTHESWNASDPRHLELHHIEHYARGGTSVEDNLRTLCTVCHDDLHRRERPS